MSERPKDINDFYWKIISAIADDDSSTKEKMTLFLKEEGLNPEDVFKNWDKDFEAKLEEFRKNKIKTDQTKNSQQKRRPKGPKL